MSDILLRMAKYLPIILGIVCLGYAVYIFKNIKWTREAVVSLIISLLAGLTTGIQALVFDYNTNQTLLSISDDNKTMLSHQKFANDVLEKMVIMIDSNEEQISKDDAPDDEITDWVVANRYDVMYKKDIFYVDIKERKEGEKGWLRLVDADVGDVMEFQIEYINKTEEQIENLMIRVVLPTNLEYLPDTTKVYNSNYQDGVLIRGNTVITDGINIGNYEKNGLAYVKFKARIIDVSLANGLNELVIWASATQNQDFLKCSTRVYVEK